MEREDTPFIFEKPIDAIPPVKMVSPEGDHPENAYYVRYGQVVWYKKFLDKTPRFGVGVKIFRRVVQTDIMTSRFR